MKLKNPMILLWESKWTYLTATMTNSEMDPNSKKLDGAKETVNQESLIQNHISKQANDLFKGERLDFNFDSDTEDLDDLADEIFDALYDHTHKYSYEE